MFTSFQNSFSFEYGPLDDGTYWIQAPSKKLLNINQSSLEVMLKLNEGISLEQVSRACDVSEEEIADLIGRMRKEGIILKEGKGHIGKKETIKDIRLLSYWLLWIFLAIIQIYYFTHIAHTSLMNKWQEGVVVLIIALVATLGHELGHYIVAKRYFKPKLGFTFLLVFPAFYVNTQESWKLPKGIRILINLSGSLFDLIINTAAIFLVIISPKLEYYVTPFLITQFSRWALVLNPLFPTDFYWILSDLTKIVNLRQKARESLFKFRLNLLSLYALLSYVFIAISLCWFGIFIVSVIRNLLLKF